MDEAPIKPKLNKTTAGIALVAALAAIPQLRVMKDFLMGDQKVTNERLETTMKESFLRLEAKIDRLQDEATSTHRRMRDIWHDEVVTAESRCEKLADRIDGRVSNIEGYIFRNKKGG